MYKNRITQSVLAGLATLISAISWVGLENILSGGNNWLWPSIGFLILLIFLSLNWLLTKSKAVLLITLILILVSFFFVFSFKIEYLAVLFIALLFFLFGSFRAINEKKVRIKIQVDKILRRGLPSILTGLALVIAVAFYFSPLALQGQNKIEVPRFLFDIVVQPIIVDIPLSGDMLYQAINQEINKYGQPYQQYFPLGLAMGIFFALKTIGFLFGWLVILLSWLIFKVLVSAGAIKIQEQAVLKEVIEV
ncbi:MAG: hypothetical protein ISS88_00765 [Candidatus Portnoybacteria bacterium]|nr:hypothetical protein [Candidatus Portnoybacteria bacterium]